MAESDRKPAGRFLLGPQGMAKLVEGAEIYHDDPPRLEYAVAQLDSGDQMAIVQQIKSCLEPVRSILDQRVEPHVAAHIERPRAENLRDI